MTDPYQSRKLLPQALKLLMRAWIESLNTSLKLTSRQSNERLLLSLIELRTLSDQLYSLYTTTSASLESHTSFKTEYNLKKSGKGIGFRLKLTASLLSYSQSIVESSDQDMRPRLGYRTASYLTLKTESSTESTTVLNWSPVEYLDLSQWQKRGCEFADVHEYTDVHEYADEHENFHEYVYANERRNQGVTGRSYVEYSRL